MFLLYTLIFLSFVFLWKHLTKRQPKAPPGPTPLPIIGNLHQMAASDPWGFRAYHKLSRKYGDIMSIKIGLREMAILSSAQIMKDILSKEEASGRLWFGFLEDRSNGKELGISFGNGDRHKSVKAYVLKTLKEVGFGNQGLLESHEHVEAAHLKTHINQLIQRSNNATIPMWRFFQPCLFNVLWTNIARKRYDYDDPLISQLMDINKNWFASVVNFGAGIVTGFPWLRFVFKDWTGYNTQIKGNKIVYRFLQDVINESKNKGAYESETPASFVEAFLQKIDEDRASGGQDKFFTDEEFLVTLYDLFQNGFETTSNSLNYAILFMVLHPEVQKKVQEELDLIIGNQAPSLRDRERCPYTRATVLECLRLGNILPIPGPRVAKVDIPYGDYVISRGTAITFNIYSAMRDKILGEDTSEFRPERFLNADGSINLELEKYLHVLFGYGRRACAGQPLAQTTMWIYFTTLLQSYSFNLVPGGPIPSTEPVFSIILQPQPYEAIVSLRKTL